MTTRSFNDMLNEYLTNSIVENTVLKKSWLLQNVEIDTGHPGGTVPVPFEGNAASSINYNGLTSTSDIAEFDYVRGTLASPIEVWGSLLFRHRDLMDGHGGIKEKSFLKILPNQIERFATIFKESVSTQILDGPVLANAVSDGTAGGVIGVDKIDRFQINQKVVLDDGNSSQGTYYVIAVDINNKEITLSASRGGAAADISAYTVAQSAKLYEDGVLVGGTVTNKFESLRDILLSSANGGASTVHGQTKASYPVLQAFNYSGASATSANLMDKIFDCHTEFRARARAGMPTKIVMSNSNLGACMKAIEVQKGAFKTSVTQTKATQYGWSEIEIMGVTGGALTLVGVTEIKDDIIMGLDMSSMKYLSVGEMFKKRTAPDGKQYFEVRDTTAGYSYVLDMCNYGQFQVHSPQSNWIMHSVDI